MKCGQPQCACHRDPAKRHGPYFEWTYKAKGKTVNVKLSPQAALALLCGSAAWREILRSEVPAGRGHTGEELPLRTKSAVSWLLANRALSMACRGVPQKSRQSSAPPYFEQQMWLEISDAGVNAWDPPK
jgi:hypothetical protein